MSNLADTVDQGIYLGHREFQGRATFGANFAGEGNNNDGNGHGTHVSGTIGGVTFGVANNVSLIAVKVFDATGQGSISGVIAGIEFAVSDAKNNSRIEKSVANLSLGGGFSEMLNAAATEAVNEGLFLAVAAGNGDENGIGQPIRNVSPASAPRVCTVAAIDQNDVRASFSNFGRVDVFAPGVNVLSAYIGSPNTAGYLSGTSMSTPHVAGLVAYLLGLPANGAKRGGLALCDRIKRLSTKDAVKDARGQNRIAYNGAQELVHEQGQTWG